jgi:Flp pilus assembly protein TadG
MRYPPTPPRRGRRGAVLAQVVLCLTALVGVLAITLDGGVLLAERRRAQATADAAALAAVADLFKNYMTNNGVGTSSASTSAMTTASANGYTGSNSVVTVNLNPSNYQGGPNAGTQIPPGYAEVIVTYNQPRFFSSLWGTANLPVSARAVARGQWLPASPGVLVLNPTAPGALTANGNGDMTVWNAPIVVDSNSSSAITVSGTHSVVADPSPNQPILDFGGYSGSGTVNPTPTPLAVPTPDPLRFLPEPSSTMAAGTITNKNGVTTLTPGYFGSSSNLTFNNKTVVLNPGIYYIDTAFSVQGNSSGSVTGNGVMLFISTNGSLSLAGQGTVTLSPPTSGTYQGVTVFEDRTSTTPLNITGNGKFNLTGTFYAAKAPVKVAGNGDASLGSQYISDTVQAAGNGVANIVYNNNTVGRTRVLNLVE